jgi:acetylornithine deacetylase/succinyl-diaminopimelate desuccinylase-like protein
MFSPTSHHDHSKQGEDNMKRTILLALALVICTIGAVIGTSVSATRSKVEAPRPVDSPNTIDGAKNPELIPDRVAYTLLFRLIANRQSEQQRINIRGYVRQMGLGMQRCKACPKPEGVKDADDDSDLYALIAAAEEFHERVSVLDKQAKEIREANRITPNPQMMPQLELLQREKEAIVDEIVASLPGRLSTDATEKVRSHIKDRVKAKIKMDSRSAVS